MNIFILVQACRGDDTDSGMMDEEELYQDSDQIKVKFLKRRREGIDSIPMSICSELDHARYGFIIDPVSGKIRAKCFLSSERVSHN